MSTTERATNIKLNNPGPLDAWEGPYNSIAEACTAIENTATNGVNFRLGKKPVIRENGKLVQYWWAGNDFSDAGISKFVIEPNLSDFTTKAEFSQVEQKTSDFLNGEAVNPTTQAGKYIIYNTGVIADNAGYTARIFPVVDTGRYLVTAKTAGSQTALAVFFNSNMQYIGYQERALSTITEFVNKELTLPSGTAFVGVSTQSASGNVVFTHVTNTQTIKDKIIQNTSDILNNQNSINTVNTAIASNNASVLEIQTAYGNFSPIVADIEEHDGYFYNKIGGVLTANAGYYSVLFPLPASRSYVTTKFSGSSLAMAVFFDSNKNFIGNQNPNSQSGVVISWDKQPIIAPSGTAFIGLTSAKSNQAKPLLNVISGYTPLPRTILSPLTDKIIGSAGDSITYGQNATDINDGVLPLGGAAKKNHMYFIAKRTGAKWYNYGVSGSTMGDVFAEGSDKNGFSKANGRYTTMAANLDYIPIMFGTNDNAYGQRMVSEQYIQGVYGEYLKFPRTSDLIGQTGYFTQAQYNEVLALSGLVDGVTYSNNPNFEYHRRVYIGTLNDSTNKTWCGAWNIVIPYLINKYPKAKILVWLNPTNDTFTEITKKLCLKWGLPYLNMFEDNAPLIWYKATPASGWGTVAGVSVLNFRKNTLTADGTHPNDDGYEYLSTIIESALLRI